jgi:hypothetical protein
VQYTPDPTLLESANYIPAARLAESLGSESVGLSESVFFPHDTSSAYPYNDDGSRTHLEDKPFLDVFPVIQRWVRATRRRNGCQHERNPT